MRVTVQFDAYEYVLPRGFAGNTLTSITLTGSLDTGSPERPALPRRRNACDGASPVPEPSTWAMMIAGFAGLGWLGFSRRRAIGSAAA